MAEIQYPLSPADAALSLKQRQARDKAATHRPATAEELAALEWKAPVDPKAPKPAEPDYAALKAALDGKTETFQGKVWVKK